MINKTILNKLSTLPGDKNTYKAVLYAIHIQADSKMLRQCGREVKELRDGNLIETNEKGDKIHLTVPFFQHESDALSESGKPSLIAQVSKYKEESVSDWINAWRELFPKGRKETGLSYIVKGDPVQCSKRMKEFINEYGFCKDTVFKATELYLREQKNKGWSMTKKAHKFIKDREGSVLSEYCELVSGGDYKDPEKDSFINVV